MNDNTKLHQLKIYFEKQGFVVRDGLRYGVDFLLYTDLVEKVHSRYALLLNRNYTFHQLIAIQRVCDSTKKELILADLIEDDVKIYRIDKYIFEDKSSEI